MRTLVFILVTLLPLLADIGHVGAYSGSAKLVRKGVITEIQSGLVLQKSDSIITASQSKVQLIMEDETIITIGPLSHFEIDSYQFEPNKKSNLSLRLQRGFFRSITGKIGKVAPERFKIHTKSATIGVRGTDFAAYVDEQSEYIGCFNGAITVTAGEKNFEVDAHMMISLIESEWRQRPLDIEKFFPVLISNKREPQDQQEIKPPFDPSIIDNLAQQERLQNADFKITPGYDVQTPPPPQFIP